MTSLRQRMIEELQLVAAAQLLRGNHEQLFEGCLALHENTTLSPRICLARRAYASTYSISQQQSRAQHPPGGPRRSAVSLFPF